MNNSRKKAVKLFHCIVLLPILERSVKNISQRQKIITEKDKSLFCALLCEEPKARSLTPVHRLNRTWRPWTDQEAGPWRPDRQMGLNIIHGNLCISRDEWTQENWRLNLCLLHSVHVISDKAPHAEENPQRQLWAQQRPKFPTAGCRVSSLCCREPLGIQRPLPMQGDVKSYMGSLMIVLYTDTRLTRAGRRFHHIFLRNYLNYRASL